MKRWSWRSRSILRGAVVLLLAVGLSPLLTASAAKQPPPSSAYRVGPIPFDGQVHQLGMNTFPNIYAGIKTNPDGSVVVYVTSRDPAFLTAVAAADSNGVPYTYSIVSRSYGTLESLTKTLADQFSALAGNGVHLIEEEPDPDPTVSKVDVWLGAPSSADFSALANTLGVDQTLVTAATYRADVQTYLVQRYGPAISIQATYE